MQAYSCDEWLPPPELAALATAASRAVSTPPALNSRAPQVRPGRASVAVTVTTSTGAGGGAGFRPRPTPRPTASAMTTSANAALVASARGRATDATLQPASGASDAGSIYGTQRGSTRAVMAANLYRSDGGVRTVHSSQNRVFVQSCFQGLHARALSCGHR